MLEVFSQCRFAELSQRPFSYSASLLTQQSWQGQGWRPCRKWNCSLIVSSERQRQKNTGLRAGAGKSWQGKDPERASCIHEEYKRIIFQAGGFIFFSILGFHFLLQSLLLSTKTCATSSKAISAPSNLRRGKLQLQIPPKWEQCQFRGKVLYFRDGTAGVETHLALRQSEPELIIKKNTVAGERNSSKGISDFAFGMCSAF